MVEMIEKVITKTLYRPIGLATREDLRQELWIYWVNNRLDLLLPSEAYIRMKHKTIDIIRRERVRAGWPQKPPKTIKKTHFLRLPEEYFEKISGNRGPVVQVADIYYMPNDSISIDEFAKEAKKEYAEMVSEFCRGFGKKDHLRREQWLAMFLTFLEKRNGKQMQ